MGTVTLATYVYDGDGDLLSVTEADGLEVDSTADPLGQTLTMRDESNRGLSGGAAYHYIMKY
jgi:YD repeat-containing protein